MARILVDDNDVVISWERVGNGWNALAGTTIVVDEIPQKVSNAPLKYWIYTDGEYTVNPDYVPPVIPPTVEEQIAAIVTANEVRDEYNLDNDMRISMLELGI